MDIQSTQLLRVAFIGAIANPNVGDEAILEENIRIVDAMYGKNKIVYVFSKDPSYTSLTSLNTVIPVDYIHRLTLRCNFDITRIRSLCDEVIGYVPGSALDADFEAIHQILSSIDVLHIIGGGYLNGLWSDMTEEVRVAAKLAHGYGARVIATGIGIYPIAGKELGRFSDIVDVCEFVDFRDESVGLLSDEMRSAYEDKLYVTTDDAVAFGKFAPERWIARIPAEVKSASMGGYLNVALHCNDAVKESGILENAMRLADHLYGKGLIDHANILGFSPDDLNLCRDFDAKTSGVSCPIRMLDLWRYPAVATQYIVSRAKANLGSRYHQAVFSLASGVPVLSFSINSYYTYKLQAIHSQVNSDRVLPISDATWDALLRFSDSLEKDRCDLAHSISEFEVRRERKIELMAKVYSGEGGDADMLLDRAVDSNPIKISVIVPVYNMERYLRECLDSILAQTIKEIEVICIDDGSTDDTSKILYEYGWKDRRVKVISQANSGVSAARNAGLKAARGEFVAFVDPDDWLASRNVLSTLYWAAKNNDMLAVCGGFVKYDVGGGASREAPREVVSSWELSQSGYEMPSEGRVSYRDFQFDYGWVRFIYDRQTLITNDLWFPERKFYEDPVWFTRVMDVIGEFWATTIPMYCYRVGHKSRALSEDRLVDLLRGMTEIFQLSAERGYSQLWSLTYSRLTHDYAPLLSPALCADKPCQELEDALAKLNAVIADGCGGRAVERIVIRNGERESAGREVRAVSRKLEIVKRESDSAKKELAETKRAFETAKREFDTRLTDEVARIKNSRTWKVGSIVWWLPRKIRDFLESR